jgi:hypothetical protein
LLQQKAEELNAALATLKSELATEKERSLALLRVELTAERQAALTALEAKLSSLHSNHVQQINDQNGAALKKEREAAAERQQQALEGLAKEKDAVIGGRDAAISQLQRELYSMQQR